jgi:hypothetical protein
MDRSVEIVEEAANRLRELEPDLVAVLVYGSFAREEAEEGSDLDLRGLTETEEPRDRYRMWFEERPDAPPLHVSTSAERLDAWLERRTAPDWWTFGFPARQILRYVWATDGARRRLGPDPSFDVPAGEPELEDFVEYVGKVRRSASRGDLLGARLFAQGVGLLAPRLLRDLNDDVVVRDRREALDAALSLRNAPDGYGTDLRTVLGLAEAGDEMVVDAALRLGRGLLTFLRERSPQVDGQPDIAGYLADSTLERHLGFVD